MPPQQPQLDDHALVLSAQQGSLEAFNDLFEKYYLLVVRRVRYTVPEEDAEDVAQEVFLAVMRSLKSFREEAKFTTWLRVPTSRQIADYYRHRKPSGEALKDDQPSQANDYPTDDILQLRQALQRLPEKYREIIYLRFAEDIPFNEIARLQRRSLEGTKSYFRRAVTALGKLMRSDEPSNR